VDIGVDQTIEQGVRRSPEDAAQECAAKAHLRPHQLQGFLSSPRPREGPSRRRTSQPEPSDPHHDSHQSGPDDRMEEAVKRTLVTEIVDQGLDVDGDLGENEGSEG